MPTALEIRNGVATSLLRVDHAPGDLERSRIREVATKDLGSPWNEGFTFTEEEWLLLQKTRPALFDPDPVRRLANWKTWAASSEGRAFRVK